MTTRQIRAVLAGATLLLLMLGACKKDQAAVEKPDDASSQATTDGGAGKVSKGGRTWADLLGLKGVARGKSQSLAEAAKTFQSYDTCVERVALRLPPELGVEMYPRDDLPDAVCRVREAIARRDRAVCKLAKSYRLRKSCTRIFAIHHGDPEACPLRYPKRRGRDGYCLAMAQRDPSLCRASAKEAEEARCLAILGANADACARLRPREQPACRAGVKRWAHLKAGASALPAGYKPSMSLTLLRGDGSTQQVDFECADYGVVVPRGGGKVNFCEYHTYGYRSSAYRGAALGRYRRQRDKLKLAFSLPAEGKGAVTLTSSDIAGVKLSGYREYSQAPTGEISIERFDNKRGGRLVGTINLSVGRGSERIALKGRFDAFIRDIVDAREMRFNRYDRYRRGAGGLLGAMRQRGGGWGTLGSGTGRGTGLGGSKRRDRDRYDDRDRDRHRDRDRRRSGLYGQSRSPRGKAGLSNGMRPLDGDKQKQPRKRTR